MRQSPVARGSSRRKGWEWTTKSSHIVDWSRPTHDKKYSDFAVLLLLHIFMKWLSGLLIPRALGPRRWRLLAPAEEPSMEAIVSGGSSRPHRSLGIDRMETLGAHILEQATGQCNWAKLAGRPRLWREGLTPGAASRETGWRGDPDDAARKSMRVLATDRGRIRPSLFGLAVSHDQAPSVGPIPSSEDRNRIKDLAISESLASAVNPSKARTSDTRMRGSPLEA